MAVPTAKALERTIKWRPVAPSQECVDPMRVPVLDDENEFEQPDFSFDQLDDRSIQPPLAVPQVKGCVVRA